MIVSYYSPCLLFLIYRNGCLAFKRCFCTLKRQVPAIIWFTGLAILQIGNFFISKNPQINTVSTSLFLDRSKKLVLTSFPQNTVGFPN